MVDRDEATWLNSESRCARCRRAVSDHLIDTEPPYAGAVAADFGADVQMVGLWCPDGSGR